MKTYLFAFFGLALIGFGIYAIVADDFPSSMHSYITNGDLLTLETRYTPDEIIAEQKNFLTGNSQRTLQEPSYVFHPYLLCEVKYSDHNQKTRYGTILWSLLDGEMVLNGDTWEKTRGFEDALKANTTPLEFKLLHALADHRGTLTRDRLQKELHLDQKALNSLIERVKSKQLVIVKGNELILHFENPLFHVAPETVWASVLVVKPQKQGKKIPALYTHSSIERLAKAAFGDDFAIRSKKEVYLPVIRIPLQIPDGSILPTEWNAVTGDEIPIKTI